MEGDIRKRALELARKRARQRSTIEADSGKKEKERKEREEARKKAKDEQEYYLNKLRQDEERKKEEERNRLAREMDRLKQKQQAVKDAEERERKRQELEKKQEAERLKKVQQEKEKQLEEQRLAAERERVELAKKAEYLARKEQEIQAMRQKPLDELPEKSTREIISTISESKESVSFVASKNRVISKLVNIQKKTVARNNTYSIEEESFEGDLQETLTFELERTQVTEIQTINHEERRNLERLLLETSGGNEGDIITLWNQINPILVQSPSNDRNNKHELSHSIKVIENNYIWLPHLHFIPFAKTLIALSSKVSISRPEELNVLLDLKKEEIEFGLIDGIYWKLITPIFAQNTAEQSEFDSQDLQSQLNRDLSRDQKYPPFIQKIKGYEISDLYSEHGTTIQSLQKYLISQFLAHPIIRDFLFGIETAENSEYPLKSMLFETNLHEQYKFLSKNEISNHIEAIVNYGEIFGLIDSSELKKYKNGKSRYVHLTRFGNQKIQKIGKEISKRTNLVNFETSQLVNYEPYDADYNCPRCNFPILTEFEQCPQCGSVLKMQCNHCHAWISKTWKICPYCSKRRKFFSKAE